MKIGQRLLSLADFLKTGYKERTKTKGRKASVLRGNYKLGDGGKNKSRQRKSRRKNKRKE